MIGNQIPRIKIEPERVDSDGDSAALLMKEYGVELDTWQKMVVDCWLGKNADNEYIVTSAGISCPRQNGKNICIEAREFFGLVINGEKILHTAHQVRTTKKAFRRLAAMFTDKRYPEIIDMVAKIRYGTGEESIELINGGSIEFSSRSRQAARGYDAISLVVFDEAQELQDEQLEALMSILSASATGIRQLIYAGTPPYPGCTGQVFGRFRQSCIMAKDKDKADHMSWHEWSIAADTLENIHMDDKALWYETNPALGVRLTEEFTTEEYKSLSSDGFARERLGWWSNTVKSKEDKVIDAKIWDACKSDDPKPEGKTAYGVKFSADGSTVVLAGAVVPSTGKARISIIDVKPTGAGLSWLARWLNERYNKAACVVIDGKNGTDLLVDKISDTWRFKGSVIKPTANNVVTAANLLLNELNEQTLTWYSGQEALSDSATTAVKRNIAGGWGFGGAGSELIEACSLALWGCRTSKRNPAKVMRIG